MMERYKHNFKKWLIRYESVTIISLGVIITVAVTFVIINLKGV